MGSSINGVVGALSEWQPAPGLLPPGWDSSALVLADHQTGTLAIVDDQPREQLRGTVVGSSVDGPAIRVVPEQVVMGWLAVVRSCCQ